MDASQVNELDRLYQQAQWSQSPVAPLFILPTIQKSRDIDRQQEACRNAPAYKPGPAVWGSATNNKK